MLVEEERIERALRRILERAEIPYSNTLKGDHDEFSMGVPGIHLDAIDFQFDIDIGGRKLVQMPYGARKIEDRLERVASQIAQYGELHATDVVRVEAAPGDKYKHTIVLNARFFSEPQHLEELERLSRKFELGPKAQKPRKGEHRDNPGIGRT
jgi:hypothetical protein